MKIYYVWIDNSSPPPPYPDFEMDIEAENPGDLKQKVSNKYGIELQDSEFEEIPDVFENAYGLNMSVEMRPS